MNIPSTFLTVACLAVAGSFAVYASHAAPEHPVEHLTVNVDTAPITIDIGTAELESPVMMPEQVIVARRSVRDPLAGPGKRCSEGAWFATRALTQGTGNVRGFCP